MLHKIEEGLDLLAKNWKIVPIIRHFVLGKRNDASDHQMKIKDVIFHIPYLSMENGYLLWKGYSPVSHNCCNRQRRLPLTSDELITISKNLKYRKVSDLVT